jgi:transcriptional regulator with XRE-family HTH domain
LVIMVVFVGVRQRELARVLGVSGSQLSRYLAGLSTVPEKTYRRLAFLLCVPPSVLRQETPMPKALQHLMEVWLPHHLPTARQRLRDVGCSITVRGQDHIGGRCAKPSEPVP